jgi:hypothetical protein
MVRDPETGKYRRTRLFVLTLGYSPNQRDGTTALRDRYRPRASSLRSS